jgi:Rps23 Pro-64 3,4-dihydroxylase Tpa1-like proline 4-hydroxylase
MFDILHSEYQSNSPYPYTLKDNFFEESFAKSLQKEILEIPLSEFDEYRNPCEKKRTLRDKENLPPYCKEFFERMSRPEMIAHLSKVSGYSLLCDNYKQYWGIHIFDEQSKLAVHVDAGIHPKNGLKKQVTFGYYVSKDWKEGYGCELEIWKGDNAAQEDPQLYQRCDTIAPLFNRAVLFTCNDYSWHGVSNESLEKPESAKRIFLTLSYLSENTSELNKRARAFFIPRPTDENKEEILEFSKKRASESFSQYYRTY